MKRQLLKSTESHPKRFFHVWLLFFCFSNNCFRSSSNASLFKSGDEVTKCREPSSPAVVWQHTGGACSKRATFSRGVTKPATNVQQKPFCQNQLLIQHKWTKQCLWGATDIETHEQDQAQRSFSCQIVIRFIRLQPLEMWPVIDSPFMRLFQLKTQLQVHFHYDRIHSSLLD